MPSFSHSSSPGLSPRLDISFASASETSLLVTMMQRRCPPSSTLRRFTACIVVPESEKKSTIRALGLFTTKNWTASWVAYTDFGKVNLRPIISFNILVPFCVASWLVIHHCVPGRNLASYPLSSTMIEPSGLYPTTGKSPFSTLACSPCARYVIAALSP